MRRTSFKQPARLGISPGVEMTYQYPLSPLNPMRIATLILAITLCTLQQSIAQPYTPAPENLENREWFQDAKFGLFIHWGAYSVLGVHEWVMERQDIDKSTYEKVATFFNPTEFDPDAWVAMAKDAGMKYITITAKHHDGFAMYDSEHTDWDIVDRTVYGQDVLKQLAEACRRGGQLAARARIRRTRESSDRRRPADVGDPAADSAARAGSAPRG